MTKIRHKAAALAVSAAAALTAVFSPLGQLSYSVSAVSAGTTLSDMPASYVSGADWIWQNRIMREDSLGINSRRWNSLFDQIIANKGQLNYVVRWQSTKQITYEQRKSFEKMVDEGINRWTDWLVGYEAWPYSHVKVNIVGWAVLDRSALLDIHSDEVIWDNIKTHDDLSDSQQGVPSDLPCADETLWTFNYFRDRNHVYNGQSFDEYLWCTQNYGDYGGCGGDWGQRLSDNFYLAAASGSGFPHIYWHELGHGFGMTDFYGGEGASDGFPPGGFPGGENSIMMAGSCSYINDFDGWMLRYMWSHIKDDTQRFNLANAVDPGMTETITTTTTTETTVLTSDTAASSAETETTAEPQKMVWQVPTGGAQKLRLIASGMPWAGVSGQYGYWNNLTQEWVQVPFRYEDSLGDSGSAAIEIDFGAAGVTDQLQVEVWYYAAWDNALGDMAACDPATLSFTAEPVAEETVTTTTTTVTETTESSTTAQRILRGDADCSGMVELSDAVLLAKASAGVAELSVAGKNNAELNGDGVITSDDLRLLLLYLSGSIDEL